eukprot:g734.t1
MLAALRSLLPKTWSTTHETAWEWLWATISRNLSDSSSKVRAFKVYNAQLFGALKEEHLNTFRNDLYTDFFAKCAISQDIFKQSQTRLHYIADRVLQSSYDMFHKPKQERLRRMTNISVWALSDSSMPKSESTKIVACAVAGMTQAEERDVPEHMMVEGFRWSIGLVARLLMRIITEGSTAVMQAIYQDSAKLLQAALKEAPREYRNFLQLRVRVGSQKAFGGHPESLSLSLTAAHLARSSPHRSGAHTAARTMLEDVLTIRADRDRYYYGVNDIFKFQPDIAADLLQEAPKLMISRAFVSFVRFRNPKIIVHPILIFVSDLVWNKLVRSYFMYDQIFRSARLICRMINFVIFILAGCFLNQPTVMRDPVWSKALVGVRVLVYTMGFAKLLYSHDWKIIWRVRVPTYLLKGPEMLSFMLMLNMASMMVVEPMIHCFGTSENFAEFQCENWTDDMSLAYEVFLVIGIFLYVFLIFGIGSSISIEISEYRVLCMSAVKQVALCLGVVTLAIFTFGFVITAMTREIGNLSSNEFMDVGSAISNLARLAIGMMDTGELRNIAEESPFLLIAPWQGCFPWLEGFPGGATCSRVAHELSLDEVISMFMLLVCSFFFNILVSQFCGVYSSLAEDSEGHARLSRGEVILDTLKAVQMKQWKSFVDLLALDQRTDFDEGDIGLAGGVKVFEPAGANPKTQEMPDSMIQRTIAHSLKKLMKGSAKGTESDQTSSVTKNSSEQATEWQPVSEGSPVSGASREDTATELIDFDNLEEGLSPKDKIGADTMSDLLELSQTEVVVLNKSWEMFMVALGGERETVGDAIFGALSDRLVFGRGVLSDRWQEAFKGRPRAIISLNLFNGFRLLCNKVGDAEDLRKQVETLAFKHLGNEINQQRVDGVTESFLELVQQSLWPMTKGTKETRPETKAARPNVPNLPPGAVNVWQKMLTYTGSCCRYISATYTERLKIIQEDWAVIQTAQEADAKEHEDGEKKLDGCGCGTWTHGKASKNVDRSFGGMCAFSNEVIGQETEGWMLELLQVFGVLVERIGNPSHLLEDWESNIKASAPPAELLEG